MREVLDQLFPPLSLLNRMCTFFLHGYEESPPEVLSPHHNCTTLMQMVSWFHPTFDADYDNQPTRIFF